VRWINAGLASMATRALPPGMQPASRNIVFGHYPAYPSGPFLPLIAPETRPSELPTTLSKGLQGYSVNGIPSCDRVARSRRGHQKEGSGAVRSTIPRRSAMTTSEVDDRPSRPRHAGTVRRHLPTYGGIHPWMGITGARALLRLSGMELEIQRPPSYFCVPGCPSTYNLS